jgi:hypothetical protein
MRNQSSRVLPVTRHGITRTANTKTPNATKSMAKTKVTDLLPKRSLTHKKAKRIHFENRFRERVGYLLTEEKYRDIQNRIVKDGKFIHKDNDGNSISDLNVDGVILTIVHNPFTGDLITVLGRNKN